MADRALALCCFAEIDSFITTVSALPYPYIKD